MKNADVYLRVFETVIEAMKSGDMPWTKPWAGNRLPFNVSTGRSYSGGNVLPLWLASSAAEYRTNGWLTFKQALECGVVVRKGEKGQPVFYMSRSDSKSKEDGEGNSFFFAKMYFVFNLDQLDDLEAKPGSVQALVDKWNPKRREHQPHEECEAVIAATGAAIVYGDSAYYSPKHDRIILPTPERFHTRDGYYAVAFHELAHWTGAESRLDRALEKGKFGDPEYAFEELVAELGAAFCSHRVGIPHASQAATYIKGWLKALTDRPQSLGNACTYAMRAAGFIFGDADEAAEVAEAAAEVVA